MNKQPHSATDEDRLDQVLAAYMEEADLLKDAPSELCALQEKYLDDHPDLALPLLRPCNQLLTVVAFIAPPHGFITTKLFPASFCELGVGRFQAELFSGLPDCETSRSSTSLGAAKGDTPGLRLLAF